MMLPSLSSSNCLATATGTGHANHLQRGCTMTRPDGNSSQSSCMAETTPCLRQGPQRQCKRAKNHSYTNLLNSAPMLPSSPDLEDRALRTSSNVFHQTPCFSPRVWSTTLMSPPPLDLPGANPLDGDDAALPSTLPSLDMLELDMEQRAASSTTTPGGTTVPTKNNWLRMKRRQSLVYALRLAASTS